MSKSPEMEAYLHTLQPTRSTAMGQGKCVVCGGDASEFKDDISAKEYTISGLCQECQDEAFAPYDEDEEEEMERWEIEAEQQQEDPFNEQDWRADR